MKVRSSAVLTAIVLAAITVSAGSASAATITLRTGVDGALAPLGENVADPFWTISVQGGLFQAAEVVNSEVICCGMESVSGAARWISDQSVTAGTPNTGWGVGPTAVARRTFDLTGLDHLTASLVGNWRVADLRQGVFLNGVLIQANTADGNSAWGVDQALALAAGSGLFVAGINVLELRGSSINSGWDGFWLDATVTADAVGTTPVPEPATFALLGLGLAAVWARRRLA